MQEVRNANHHATVRSGRLCLAKLQIWGRFPNKYGMPYFVRSNPSRALLNCSKAKMATAATIYHQDGLR